MRVYRRSKFQRYLVIPLMLTCFLSGCYKWSIQPAPPTSDEAPEQVRVMLSDGCAAPPRQLRPPEDRPPGCPHWFP